MKNGLYLSLFTFLILLLSCYSQKPTEVDRKSCELAPKVAWKAAGEVVYPQAVDSIEIRIESESLDKPIVKRFAFSDKKATFSSLPKGIVIGVTVLGLTAEGDTLYSGITSAVTDQPSVVVTIDAEMVTPPSPSQLEITLLDDGRVMLTWEDNSMNELEFMVVRTEVESDVRDTFHLDADAETWTDESAVEDRHYSYAVLTRNQAGWSEDGAVAEFTVPPRPELQLTYEGETVKFAGETCSLKVTLVDLPSDSAISITPVRIPEGATYNNSWFKWATTASDTVDFLCSFEAADSLNRYRRDTLKIKLSVRSPDQNLPPLIEAGDYGSDSEIRVREGKSVSFKVSTTDRNEGDIVTLKALSTSPWEMGGEGSYDTISGLFTYTPDFGTVTGTDTVRSLGNFTFRAVDDGTPPESAELTVEIIVLDSNSAPEWISDTISLNATEGKKFSYALSDVCSDDEKDSVSFSADTGSVEGDKWSWTPPFGTASPVFITFIATDGKLTSECVVKFTLSDSNSVPLVFDSLGIVTDEDTPVDITLGAKDPDGATLIYHVSEPDYGTVSGSGPEITYTPADEFSGVDTVMFFVSDGVCSSEVATVRIRVLSLNDPPSFSPLQNRTVKEGEDFEVVDLFQIVSDPDNEDSTLLFSAYTWHGLDVVIERNLATVQTPDSDWFGKDTVTFVAEDREGLKDSVNMVCEVLDVNDAPSFSAGDDTVSVGEDCGPVEIQWATSIKAGPSNESSQTVSFLTEADKPELFTDQPFINSSGSLTFTPAPDSTGEVRLSVTARDDGGVDRGGVDSSSTSTILVIIRPQNDAPEIVSAVRDFSIDEDDTLELKTSDFEISDPDNSPSDFSLSISDGVNHTVSGDRIIPAPDYNGNLTVNVAVQDKEAFGSPFEITVTVNPVNDAPQLIAGSDIQVPEDAGAKSYANWADLSAGPENERSQSLSVRVDVDNPSLFSVLPKIDSSGTLTFTSARDSNGVATMSIIAYDDGGTELGGVDSSSRAEFTITVSNDNDAPVIESQKNSIETDEETAVDLSVSDLVISDIDNPTGPFTLTVKNGSNYTVSGTSITPADDFNGELTVQITVSDGENTSNPFNMSVEVLPVNDAPVVSGVLRTLSVPEEEPITLSTEDFVINDVDNPGGPFTLSVASGAHYSVSGTVVTPADDFTGVLSVAVRANDGLDTGLPYMVDINVTPVNDAPEIKGMVSPLSIVEDSSLILEPSHFVIEDPDNTEFDLTAASGQNYSVSGGNIIIPDPEFNGVIQVPVTADDGILSSKSYVASIEVTAVNDPPVVGNIPSQRINEGGTFSDILLSDYVSDVDVGDGITWSTSPSNPENLNVSILSSGIATISVKDPEWNGTEAITFIATDDGGLSDSDAASFTVNYYNDPPILSGVSNKTVAEKQLLTFTVTASDADGPAPTLSATNLPQGATFSKGVFSWRPDYDQSGTYVVTFKAVDAADPNIITSEDATIYVTNTDRAPEFISVPSDGSVAMGKSYSASISAGDPDGDALTYSLVQKPSGMTISGTNINWTPDMYTVTAGPNTVTVRASANNKTTEATWDVTVTPHIWERFSELPGDYWRGTRNYVAFHSDSIAYRMNFTGGGDGSSTTLERLFMDGDSDWETTPVTVEGTFLHYFSVMGNKLLVTGSEVYEFDLNTHVCTDTFDVSGHLMYSPPAIKMNGDWFAGTHYGGMGGCGTALYENGIEGWYSHSGMANGSCHKWYDIEVTPNTNVVCAISRNGTTYFNYTAKSSSVTWDLAENQVILDSEKGVDFTQMSLDQNNGDTAFVLDPENFRVLRTADAFTSPAFSPVQNAEDVSPVKIRMISGYAGWVTGSDGIAYFTNDGFKTPPIGESTSDGGLIEEVVLSADGKAIFAIGRDDGSGLKVLYKY